jgi:hypothetical protein
VTITIPPATPADSDLIRELGAGIFTDTFGPANTPENMRAYLDIALLAKRASGGLLMAAGAGARRHEWLTLPRPSA